jgi:transglutaminase-like putative cysteine protease
MATTEQIDIARFLAADDLIQADQPEIIETARRITEGATSDREKAVRIFYWIRDGIAYCIEADRPALDVLREGRGVCVTKGVLHVALLRAAGVPARIGHADYKSDVLRQMFPDAYIDSQPDVYPLHTFAEAYLDGRWVTCDATVDRAFSEDLGFTANEFDGETPTEPMPGDENIVRRYWSASGPEMMELYSQALGDIDLSHDELRRQYQLLDVYVEVLRMRKRLEGLERTITAKLL